MTDLRKQMLEELQRRNYAQSTVKAYIRIVREFANYFHQSPDQLGPEQIREYQAHLFQAKKLDAGTVQQHVAGLRFFFVKMLKRQLLLEELPMPKRYRKLPQILSPEEIAQLIDSSSNLFHRTMLMTLYSTGMRRAELCRLKDGAPKAGVAPVTAFETGTNRWRRLPTWPAGCVSGCAVRAAPLYLTAGLKLGFTAPKPGDAAFDEYVSDPAKPVPYRARPIDDSSWSRWLVDDQREASGRPDVAVFVSEVLSSPVKISGQPIANLIASTSGTDSDWVVKLIDVFPDEVAGRANLGGYQLMISADIFRGRYRESLETAEPIAPDKPLLYRFALPTANHVFLPGHRLMVQIQSSWFPLYDRNPQTFVPNIFWAKPEDYRKAVQRVYHAPDQASFIELPLVATP